MLTAKEARSQMPDLTLLKKEILEKINTLISQEVKSGNNSTRYIFPTSHNKDLVNLISKDLRNLEYSVKEVMDDVIEIQW